MLFHWAFLGGLQEWGTVEGWSSVVFTFVSQYQAYSTE